MASNQVPQDVESERSLLASLCAPGNEAQALEVGSSLCEADFIHPVHRDLFKAMMKLAMAGDEITPFALRDSMGEASSKYRDSGFFITLTELLGAGEIGRPAKLAEILVKKRKYRDLTKLGYMLSSQASNEECPVEELVGEASAVIADLSQGRIKKGLKAIGDVGVSAIQTITEIRAGRRMGGVATGIPRLDYMTGGGFKPGQLIILAARPGIGKTALALQWAFRMAEKSGPVAFWMLEMSEEEVWNRIAGRRAGVPSFKIANGMMDKSEWQKVQDAREDIQGYPLLLNDQAEITVPEIRIQYDRALAQMGEIKAGFVDYLQLLTSPKDGNKNKSEATRVGELSRSLKLMAKDRGVPLIVLSQLNREVEKRSNGKPQLSDLRDSGSIEQDADMVIFLHRKTLDPKDNTAELIVAKHRNGPTGVITLETDMTTYDFKEKTRETNPEPPPVARHESLL